MRILVADGFAPFIDEREAGPAVPVAQALHARRHEVDVIRLPRGGDATDTALATRLTDVTDGVDLLIAVGRPAHLLRHPRKVIWCDGEDFAAARELAEGDRAAFAEAHAVIASSAAARNAVLAWWDGDVAAPAPADSGVPLSPAALDSILA